MLKKIGLLAAGVLLASSMAFAEPRILAASGIARVIPTGGSEALDAVPGMILAYGSEVKTGETGRVTIEISPGNSIRLRENGRINLLEPKLRENRIQFIAGKIKGVFKHLVGGEKFSVEFSDNAVASVKGTEFGVEEQGDGIRINTFLGCVAFNKSGKGYLIPQGMALYTTGGRIRIEVLGELIVSEWKREANSDAGRVDDGGRTGSSDELKSFAVSVRDVVTVAKEVITQLREEDFATGRTLRDVHGNLTRVDQRIIRPDASTIAFVNLVKRDEYKYTGRWTYTIPSGAAGPSGPRYDYLEVSTKFNMDLPDSLLDWPTFFSDHSDNIEVVNTIVTLANGRPTETALGTCDRLEMIAEQKKDGAGNVIKDRDGKAEMTDRVELNGKEIVSDSKAAKGPEYSGEDTNDLWFANYDTFVYDTNKNGEADAAELTDANRFRLYTEAYAINNSGKVLNLNDFINAPSIDPIAVMKDSAIEGIISARDMNGTSLMDRGNIDLVMTPDIVLVVAEKMASSLSSLDSGSSNSNNSSNNSNNSGKN